LKFGKSSPSKLGKLFLMRLFEIVGLLLLVLAGRQGRLGAKVMWSLIRYLMSNIRNEKLELNKQAGDLII